MKISARNCLKDRIVDVKEGASPANVKIKVGGGIIRLRLPTETVKRAVRGAWADREQSLTATAAAVHRAIRTNSWKEYTVKKLSARNQLKGKIIESQEGYYDVPCPNRHRRWGRHYVCNHERSRC